MNFGFAANLELPFEQALERVQEELKKEGFGIITSIDMREAFQKKLGESFKQYTILGACNPAFALKALRADENIGLLLPCNVVVSERGTGSAVMAFDPLAMSAFAGAPAIDEIARDVKDRLERALRALGAALTPVPA